MTDSPTPSTPQPLLSASSYCALIAADTAEAATLRRLIADSQGTTLAIDTSPQDAVELRTDPASPQAPPSRRRAATGYSGQTTPPTASQTASPAFCCRPARSPNRRTRSVNSSSSTRPTSFPPMVS